MPTQDKIDQVARIKNWIDGSTIAISTDYTGMSVTNMTELRRALRENDVSYHIVKNTLALLAAKESDNPNIQEIIDGPTGLAFGYTDPVAPAKTLVEFIKSSRLPIKIKSGVMGERVLSEKEINDLAALPSKDELISKLIGQIQSPIVGLARVLDAPITGLARVLQGRVEQL